jgi:CRP/FNR family cyclic AMP-dependent transcriptional regulator
MDAAEMLAKTNLFDDLSPEDIADLAEHLKLRRFSAGAIICNQGEIGESMYLVSDGTVRIFLPGEGLARVPLKEVTFGDYFGELSLFDEKPRSATAEACTDCEVLQLDRADVHEQIKRRPGVAIALLAELSRRLRETNALLSQRAAKDVNKMIDEKATLGDRVADRVASVAGSWAFILSFLAVLFGWIIANGVAVSKMLFEKQPFDPFPFIFFNLLLSIVAAFQGPVIMMSQNRQSLKDRAQAETDFKVNIKNEVGIETLVRGLAEVKAHLSSLEKGATQARSVKEAPRRESGNGGPA